MTKLVLHIGTQKTGTSVVQEFLSRNRAELSEQNVNYTLWGRGPSGSPAEHAQHALAHFWAKGWLSDRLDPYKVSKTWESFLDSFAAKDDQVFVVSSEHFYKACIVDPDVPHRMAEALGEHEVEVVVYFRRPDSFALSNWAHSIKTIPTFRASFSDYVTQDAIARLLNYSDNLALWQDAFGAGRTRVRLYDRKHFPDGNVVNDFLSLIGVERTPGMQNVVDSNLSLSNFSLDFFHDLDRTALDPKKQLETILEGFAENRLSKERLGQLNPLTREMLKCRAASRWLMPSAQASRTFRYKSTPAAGSSRRYRGRLLHRRSHAGPHWSSRSRTGA